MKFSLKLIAIFILTFFTSSLFSNDKVYKVAVTQDMLPFTYINNKDSKPVGFFIDYWNLWAKKAKVKVEFVSSSWNKSLENLKNKKVDIHSGLYFKQSRLSFAEYVDAFYNVHSNIYINVKNKYKIKTIGDLKGKNIGLIKGTYYESYMKKNYIDINIKTFDDYSSLFLALKNSEIDALIDDDVVIWINLLKDIKFGELIKLDSFSLDNWYFAAVKKGDAKLTKFVKKYMDEISSEELNILEEKWIFNNNLRKFDKKNKKEKLSNKEIQWLKKHKNLSLAVLDNSLNISFYDKKTKKIEGFHIDLIKLINQKLDINIKIKSYDSWNKAYLSAKENKVDGIMGLSWTKEREKYFYYSPSYHFKPFYILSRKDNNTIKHINDFAYKTVGTERNHVINKYIKEKVKNVKFKYYENVEGILKGISSGEVDVSINDEISNKQLYDYKLKLVSSVPINAGKLSIGINKKQKEFSTIIKKALSLITLEELDTLKEKWLGSSLQDILFSKQELDYIKKEQVLKIGIENWDPFIFKNKLNRPDGMIFEILALVLKTSNLKVEYVFDSWNNLLQDFKKGKIDILPTASKTESRTKYGLFSQAFFNIKDYLYIKDNNKTISSLKDLENKKLAIVKGFYSIEKVKKIFPLINIVETDSLEDSMLMVLNGKVDALLESQITARSKMKELLITNLKEIYQKALPSTSIHFFSKNNNYTLNSILDKSLQVIPKEKKDAIFSSWSNDSSLNKNLNIAFGVGRDPYTLENPILRGIEYDLVNKILKKSGFTINRVMKYNFNDLSEILNNDIKTDVAVGVKFKDDQYFYSDNFVSFDNIVITRQEDNIFINDVKDLKDKKILAFLGASEQLGKEFNILFNKNNRPSTYSEILFQEEQVKKFLNKEAEVLVLDKNIFKWFLKKLTKNSSNSYSFRYSNVFVGKNHYKIGFRNKKLRDIFNKNLKEIKNSGKYLYIIDDYVNGNIQEKSEFTVFLSLLLSKFLHDNEFTDIKELLNTFASFSYIRNIQLVKENKVIYELNKNEKSNRYIEQDIFYLTLNKPENLGSVKIYFDDKEFNKFIKSKDIIPALSFFKNLKSFSYLKEIYEENGYLEKNIYFTREEKDFILNHNNISFSGSNWEPLSIIDNNNFTGILREYLNLIEKKTSINFHFEKSKSFLEMKENLKNKKIDLLPGGSNASSYKDIGLVSNSFLSFPYAIVMNNNGKFKDGISDLKGKTLALPKGYTIYHLIKNEYPYLKIIETKNVKEALVLVSKGKADAFVGHLAVSAYNLKNFFSDLKIVGLTNEKYYHHMVIRKDYKPLLSILNKVIASISFNEKQKIQDKWINTKVDTAMDYTILYWLISIFLFILFIILFFLNKLSKAKSSLLQKTIDLEEQKKNFEILFKDTSDAVLLAKDGKYIAGNDSALRVLGYKDLKTLKEADVGTLSPSFQKDGMSSTKKMQMYFSKCKEKGNVAFEWEALKADKSHIWLDVIISKIKQNNESVYHIVFRDISIKKTLEKKLEERAIELEEKNIDFEKANEELEDSNEELQSTIQNLKQTQEQLIESEKMASLGSLVAGVAHEINTPVGIGLTGISHFEEISKELKRKYEKEEMSQEEFEEYLKTSNELANLIHINLQKAASLVRSFKQVAVDQSSEGKRRFDLKEYLEEILESIHSVTKKTEIKIEISCEEKIKINSYPGLISQVITNLIMNSIIHGYEEKKGKIKIEVKKEEEKITIDYKDDGKGIKEENINKIFEPFYTTNRDNGGSGLGLNIIYNIITQKLNGNIKCESKEGSGVRFKMEFRV